MLLGVGVDPGCEGIEVGAEVGALLPVPDRPSLVQPHRPHDLIPEQEFFAVDLGTPAAGLGVELQQQVAVVVGLRPAEGMEKAGGVLGVDVWRAPGIPEDLGPGRRGAERARARNRRGQGTCASCRTDASERERCRYPPPARAARPDAKTSWQGRPGKGRGRLFMQNPIRLQWSAAIMFYEGFATDGSIGAGQTTGDVRMRN